jgi:hypothetical protein
MSEIHELISGTRKFVSLGLQGYPFGVSSQGALLADAGIGRIIYLSSIVSMISLACHRK